MFQKIINNIKAFFTSMENETIEKNSEIQEVPLKNDNPNTNKFDFTPPRKSVLLELEAARNQAKNDNKPSGNDTSNGNTSGNSNFKRVLSHPVINIKNDEKNDNEAKTKHESEEQRRKKTEKQPNNIPLMNLQNQSYIDEIKKEQEKESIYLKLERAKEEAEIINKQNANISSRSRKKSKGLSI